MEKRKAVNRLVGRKDGYFYFLDDLFDHGNGFKGATATVLEPIPRDRYEEITDHENLKEYLEESWKMAVQAGSTTEGLDEWAEMAINVDGEEHCAGIDPSGECYYQALRDLGYSEEDYPAIDCRGGGRSFSHDMEFDEIYDSALWALIQEYEEK